MRSAPGRVLASAGLVLASLALCLGLLEVGLRLFWGGYYLKQRKSYAEPHPDRGWANKPGVVVDWGEPEFSTIVTHNRFGLRGPDVALARPPGRTRLLALGDSFTYGVGVEDDETFSARLAALDPRLEVLNAGVNNYGTTQQLLLLREEGLRFQPQIVLLAFFWNDVADSYKREFPAFRLEGGTLRYPPPRDPDDPPLVRWPDKPARRLAYSYAYRFLSDRLDLLRWRIDLALDRPVDDPFVLEPEEVEPAWALERAALREIDRLCREHQAKLLVVVIPDQVLVDPSVKPTLLGFREADVRVQDRLRAFAEETDTPLLDLLPALRRTHQQGGPALYYRQDRHLTARGHEVVAREIHARLTELGWIR